MQHIDQIFYGRDDLALKEAIHEWLTVFPMWQVVNIESLFTNNTFHGRHLCARVQFKRCLDI